MPRPDSQNSVMILNPLGRPAGRDLRASLASPEVRNRLHSVVVALQIIGGGALLAGLAPGFDGDLLLFTLLVLLTVAAERWPISLYGDSFLSVGFVLSTAIFVLFGLPGAVISALFEAVSGRVGRRSMDLLAVRSVGRGIIVAAAGASVYGLFGQVGPEMITHREVAGVLASTFVAFALSAAFITLSLWLRTGQPISSIWEKERWVAPHFAAMGVIGLALATASVAMGVFGVLAFAVPPLMLRLAMKQYVDKTAEHVDKLQRQNEALVTANVEIRRVSNELQVSYDGTLEALVNALDARDQETKGHSIRVSSYMMDIARELGVREGTKDWIDMQRGSLLHDVGKIGVSDSILLKPGKLTEEEWEWMRKHPEIGYNMLRNVEFLQGPAEIILCHHERWDGKGYPRGLAEDEIPLGARIFPVVDTFDSMTSDRPYRRAKSASEALNEILRCKGSQFDPLVVEAFMDVWEVWVKARKELDFRETVSAA